MHPVLPIPNQILIPIATAACAPVGVPLNILLPPGPPAGPRAPAPAAPAAPVPLVMPPAPAPVGTPVANQHATFSLVEMPVLLFLSLL